MKMNKIMLAMLALSVSGGAMAHGFIFEPPSRDTLCSANYSPVGIKNAECGQVTWEPQSSGENADGFDTANPSSGPRDGHLLSVSGESANYEAMNQQSADRWYKNPIQAGAHDFTWQFTAKHPIHSIKYYITKQDWDPNQVLTRASLEAEPFCVYDGHNSIPGVDSEGKPVMTLTHSCTIPQRTGYQVIYAGWDVNDTDKTFYKAIDVMFGEDSDQPGTPSSEWKVNVGSINPTIDLKAGSKVIARVFDQAGENTRLSVTLDIATDQAGMKANWAHDLAVKINAEQGDKLHAGQKNAAGEITPVYGLNDIYTKSGSPVSRVEIGINGAGHEDTTSVTVTGLKDSYSINNGKVTLDLNLQVQGKVAIEGNVFDANNQVKGHFDTGLLEDTAQDITLPMETVMPGNYSLVINSTQEGNTVPQQTLMFKLTSQDASGDYNYSWPDGLGTYKEGNRVLQPKTGKVYECKPYPYSGWCNQWTSSATQYEPGTGSNWQDAWIEK